MLSWFKKSIFFFSKIAYKGDRSQSECISVLKATAFPRSKVGIFDTEQVSKVKEVTKVS